MSLDGPLVVQQPPRTRDQVFQEALKYLAEKYGPDLARELLKPIDFKKKKKPTATGGGGAVALLALVVLAGRKRRR